MFELMDTLPIGLLILTGMGVLSIIATTINYISICRWNKKMLKSKEEELSDDSNRC